MFVSVVTCRFDPTRATFDSGPLDAFTRDKVVLSVREYFFVQSDTPHLAFVVTYRLVPPSALDGSSGRLERRGQGRGQAPRPGGRGAASRPSTDDLRAGLEPAVRERFDLLRDWRSAKSQDQGVPAYAVLTNKQLLALAQQAPRTQAGLGRVRGLGKKKVGRYGAELLAALGQPAADPRRLAAQEEQTQEEQTQGEARGAGAAAAAADAASAAEVQATPILGGAANTANARVSAPGVDSASGAGSRPAELESADPEPADSTEVIPLFARAAPTSAGTSTA